MSIPEGLVSRWAFIDNKDPNTEIWLKEEDAQRLQMKGRGAGLKGTVKDHKSGKRYKVYGASCGLPNCMCAWRTVEVDK
jgi:hypothetical protein